MEIIISTIVFILFIFIIMCICRSIYTYNNSTCNHNKFDTLCDITTTIVFGLILLLIVIVILLSGIAITRYLIFG